MNLYESASNRVESDSNRDESALNHDVMVCLAEIDEIRLVVYLTVIQKGIGFGYRIVMKWFCVGHGLMLDNDMSIRKAVVVEGAGADLQLVKLSVFPSISDLPREVETVEAAREPFLLYLRIWCAPRKI